MNVARRLAIDDPSGAAPSPRRILKRAPAELAQRLFLSGAVGWAVGGGSPVTVRILDATTPRAQEAAHMFLLARLLMFERVVRTRSDEPASEPRRARLCRATTARSVLG